MSLHIKRVVSIRNAHPRLRFSRTAVARVVRVLEANLSALRIPPSAVPAGELSLVFLTDPALAQIHADFMQDPTATDVITFAGDAAAGLAGEICVSADTAARYVGLMARRRKSTAGAIARAGVLQEAFSSELTLYLVHGWLHLAGFDDLHPARKRRMRAAEKRALALLHATRAVPQFGFR